MDSTGGMTREGNQTGDCILWFHFHKAPGEAKLGVSDGSRDRAAFLVGGSHCGQEALSSLPRRVGNALSPQRGSGTMGGCACELCVCLCDAHCKLSLKSLTVSVDPSVSELTLCLLCA